MSRYRLTIAYDGTDFAGFQLQSSRVGARTVQGVLEQALAILSPAAPPRIVGAGRTDAGVHALGQVVSFDLEREWAPQDLRRALNSLLSRDIRVLEAAAVDSCFHARRDSVAKFYRYVLDMAPVQIPIRRRYCAHLYRFLDEDRVCAAAALFLGKQDFASLASSGGATRTTLRCVFRCEARFESAAALPATRTLTVEIMADGFLRKMARSIVGGLIAVGERRMTVNDLRQALELRNRRFWPPPAPAMGLTLVSVVYDSFASAARETP